MIHIFYCTLVLIVYLTYTYLFNFYSFWLENVNVETSSNFTKMFLNQNFLSLNFLVKCYNTSLLILIYVNREIWIYEYELRWDKRKIDFNLSPQLILSPLQFQIASKKIYQYLYLSVYITSSKYLMGNSKRNVLDCQLSCDKLKIRLLTQPKTFANTLPPL